jgi:hypothetical protein
VDTLWLEFRYLYGYSKVRVQVCVSLWIQYIWSSDIPCGYSMAGVQVLYLYGYSIVGVQVSLWMQYGWSSGIPADAVWLEFRYPCGYNMVGVQVSLWI